VPTAPGKTRLHELPPLEGVDIRFRQFKRLATASLRLEALVPVSFDAAGSFVLIECTVTAFSGNCIGSSYS